MKVRVQLRPFAGQPAVERVYGKETTCVESQGQSIWSGRRHFPAERLLQMTAAIAHRGPDDEHIHLEPGVALGTRRLAIIDVAGGRQPMSNETRDVWVAFEGELYDYPESAKQLLSRGHRLATRCDTEAWVHLYEELGEGVFLRAEGQFSVSLWDQTRAQIVLGPRSRRHRAAVLRDPRRLAAVGF